MAKDGYVKIVLEAANLRWDLSQLLQMQGNNNMALQAYKCVQSDSFFLLLKYLCVPSHFYAILSNCIALLLFCTITILFFLL